MPKVMVRRNIGARFFIELLKAYLYGSYTRGEENEESDIDILLISELFDKNDDQTVGKTWRIGQSIDFRIEPYTVGRKKLLIDEFSPLLQIVKKEGLEIQAYKEILHLKSSGRKKGNQKKKSPDKI